MTLIFRHAGFRNHGSESPNEHWAEPLQCNEPQTLASAFEGLARGSSYARQSSDNMLKRRNSSVGRRSGQLNRDGASKAPDLRTIYSAASLGACGAACQLADLAELLMQQSGACHGSLAAT